MTGAPDPVRSLPRCCYREVDSLSDPGVSRDRWFPRCARRRFVRGANIRSTSPQRRSAQRTS